MRPFAQFEICGDDLLDHVGDLPVRHGRSQQCAKLRPLVSTTAEGDLVEFLAVFLHAQNADVADVMMAAGIDAARNIDVQPAKVAGEIEIAEPTGQLLGDRYGAGIGEAAVVEPRASDDVGDQPIRRGDADRVERPPQPRKLRRDMGSRSSARGRH